MRQSSAARLIERPAEHEFEAAHGLPEALPANERLLWQGSPDAWAVTRDALHLRAIGAYFAVLLAWRGATVLANGGSALDAALAVVWLLPLALAGLALIGVFGWLVSRTSVYTLTDRRVVMRIGIVLSVTFNLPYRQIEAAGLKTRADGTGDLTLLLDADSHIAYLHLWPHARPWELRRSQPMLRGLADARHVASLLAEGLKASLAPAPLTAAAAVGQPAMPLHAVSQPAVPPYAEPQPAARQPVAVDEQAVVFDRPRVVLTAPARPIELPVTAAPQPLAA